MPSTNEWINHILLPSTRVVHDWSHTFYYHPTSIMSSHSSPPASHAMRNFATPGAGAKCLGRAHPVPLQHPKPREVPRLYGGKRTSFLPWIVGSLMGFRLMVNQDSWWALYHSKWWLMVDFRLDYDWEMDQPRFLGLDFRLKQLWELSSGCDNHCWLRVWMMVSLA